jgi:UDP-N-acetylmuramyl tripeptide synthase
MRAIFGFTAEIAPIVRPHRGGAVFAYEAPLDLMLACTEMSEWAVTSAAASEPLPLEPARTEIEKVLERDRNPRLRALAAEASRRGVPFLWDDVQVTLGAGRRGRTFDRAALPDEVPWDALGTIPIALVTGTNGKTTSARLLARVAAEAGLIVGSTSSDAITVAGTTVEEGDWTGPAAARTVLRRTDVDIAVLETARGGILRRGLAVDGCDVALITNVSDDHLGLYGIDDLTQMARVKSVIASVARALVTNAADPNLVALAREHEGPVTFFADLDLHPEAHGATVVARDGVIECAGRALVRVDEVPITFGGAARYNVENALAVVAAARALGLPDDAITCALRGFDMPDNPGRGQLTETRGVRVFLDFGHNPAAVRAALGLVLALQNARPGKLTVITGAPGDRTDEEIEEIARAICEARPHKVVVRELSDYLRGREAGAVPALLRRALVAHGLHDDAFVPANSEVEALAAALEGARDGDLVALLVHLDRDGVRAFLAAR